MFGNAKSPSDRYPYQKSVESRPISFQEPIGRYVFVVDLNDTIHVAPDGLHMHPRVLGNAQDALYAGELFIDQPGHVDELTNLSGTFRFKSRRSLCCVASSLQQLGFTVGEVVWYPPNGSSAPFVLTCAQGVGP